MKKPIFLLFFLLMLLPVSSGVSGQEVSYKNRCYHCDSTGKVPNPYYETHKNLLENVRYCSWSMDKDPKGCGLSWLPCEKCLNPELKAKAEEEFGKEILERKQWLAARRVIDEKLGARKPLFHIETAHFVWAWDLPKISFEKKTYRGHEGLHKYADLLEEFYGEFQKVHGICDEENYNNYHQIFCLERQLIARKACRLYGEKDAPGGKVTKQTKPSVFVTWRDRSKMPSGEDFHRDLIHNVTHLLTAAHKTWWWLYEAGIAYEGSAHWWEIYYYKKATSHCFREINSLSNWVATKWESKVKKAVMADECPSFAEILEKHGGSLSPVDHIYSWSYIDYMMFMDSHKIMDFFDILKQKRPPRDAFKEVWGTSILGFEEQWKEFVLANYKIIEDVVPMGKRRRKGALVPPPE